jgi:sterol desaturase/sphingolipid hydroxylase (fatty acid hydroxylase superfamily)
VTNPADVAIAVRIVVYLSVLVLMAIWEYVAPRRALRSGRRRWPHNLGLMLIDTAVLRIIAPGAAVATALFAESNGWGLLNALALPGWISIALGVACLDLAIYGQHVAFHWFRPLWWLHRVHHSDLDIDVTTGVRFHPLEILLSMGIKCAAVAAVGAPVLAVVAFEVLLNACAMFNHANVRIGARTDALLRTFLVTPDMHRTHHSIDPHEQFSNFGFCVPWWDRLFRTYRAQPAQDTTTMPIGVIDVTGVDAERLDRLLVQPLLQQAPAAVH